MKTLFYKIIVISIFLYIFSTHNLSSAIVHAADCTAPGECVDNQVCVEVQKGIYVKGPESCVSSQIGRVDLPYKGYNAGAGFISFLSNLVQVFVIVAGIIAMFNFALAGYIFITSGSDPAAVGKVREKLTWTVIGLVFIVASYMGAGLIGLIFFGDAGFILQPTLYSVLD